MSYPDGTLLRGDGSAVFVVDAGVRRRVPDPATFEAHGFDWGAVRAVAAAELAELPAGADLGLPPYPDGALLKGPSRPEVFVMRRGRRCWVPDAETFTACGFRWDLIQTIPDAELRAIPWGMDVPNAAMAFEREVIARFAPRVHLHPEERYLPTSAPAFLQAAALRDRHDPSFVRAPVDQHTLVAPRPAPGAAWLEVGPTQSYYLDLPSAASRAGMRLLDGACRAPVYAHLLRAADGSFIDIQYWFLYAFNGAVWFRAGALGQKGSFPWAPFGEHEGDWEHITVRVTPDGRQLVGAFYAAHSSTSWHPAAELELVDGTHPAVYAALSTHGSYPRPQMPARFEADLGAVWFKLVDVAEPGVLWEPWRYEGGLVQVGAPGGTPLNGQAWIMFAGQWGPTRDFRREPPRLSSMPDSLADILRPFAGRIIALIPEQEVKITHGPDTPSSQGAYRTAPWLSPAHGGAGGAPFLDWRPAVGGRVDAVVIRTGRRVDRVQVTCGADDHAHGGDGGSEQRLDLAPHEYIAAVSITLTHHTTLRVSSIAVRLNTGRMIVGGTFGDRGTHTFEAPRGHQIVGFYGRSGAEVDQLGVLAVPLGAQQLPPQHISRARAPHMAWS